MKRLRDRVAVVTGAASGIGRAVAAALAERGCHLALVDVDRPGLDGTVEGLPAGDREVTLHELDVSDKAAMTALPEAVIAAHGRANIVVNNAGVTVAAKLADHSIEDFEWIVGINFWGVVYGCKFFLPHLLEQDEAHIVNVSSVFGILGIPGQSSYCATKFAVRGFSEALHAELSDTNVGVTCVHPGGIQTSIVEAARAPHDWDRAAMADRFARLGIPPERAAKRIVEAIERNRMRQIICRESYLGDWLKRLAPVSTQRLLAAVGRRSEFI